MAEGWANQLKADALIAFSAGVIPSAVNERAIEVMKEAGVDISRQYSKHIDDLSGIDFDYVVTLCDNAKQVCPAFPESTKIFHCSFEDPSFMIGTVRQVKEAFVKVRDEIRDFVKQLPEILENRQ